MTTAVSASSVSTFAPSPTPAPRPAAPAPAPSTGSGRSTMYGVPAAPAPVAAKVPLRPQTDEPLGLDDVDVLEEDHMPDGPGGDAMGYGGKASATAPTPYVDHDELPEERTTIGVEPEAAPLSPFGTEPGFDTYDAEGEVLDESDDPDPRHR
jgi:hypothetical protein